MKGVLRAKKTVLWAILLMILVISFFIYLNSAGYEIERTAKQIRSLQPALTLVMYTDMHHDPKYEVDPYQETIACIGKLMGKAHVDGLWNLGDMINGQTTTKEEAIRQIREVLAEENKVTSNVHRIQGNHDNNIQSTYSSNAGYGMEEVLSNGELNRLLENTATTQTEHHSDLRPTDYYVDFDGIRVVCITAEGTTFQPETATWLKEQALQTESQVLILSHLPTRPEWGFHGDVENGEMIEEALNDFAASNGIIIGYIHGHDHGDMIRDAGAWKEIAIGCARFQVPKSNGTEGMTFQNRRKGDKTKYLFDVVTIDPGKREVHFIRFGAGKDRKISY